MKYDPQRHQRRSVRLAGYDYSQPGAYFVTICTYKREPFLEAERVQDIVQSAWDGLPARFPNMMLDEFVMMSNHVHGIVVLTSAAKDGGAASSAPTLGSGSGDGKVAASSVPTLGSGSGDGKVAASSVSTLGSGSGDGEVAAGGDAPTLGQVIRVFKSLSAIESNKIMNRSDRPFWQRNYYDHIIRDEDEMNIIRQYIRDNPANWDLDPDNPVNR